VTKNHLEIKSVNLATDRYRVPPNSRSEPRNNTSYKFRSSIIAEIVLFLGLFSGGIATDLGGLS